MKIAASINRNIVDKNAGGNKLAFGQGWESAAFTLIELAASIDAGYAFGPQFKEGRRLGLNFEQCGFVAIDSDGSWPLQDALDDPFIQQYATLWYTTPSHGKDGKDRFRVVFALESPIKSGAMYRLAILGLAERFGTDRRIADAARVFYGSRGSKPTVLAHILPDHELKALIKRGRAADKIRRSNRLTSDATPPDEQMPDGTKQEAAVIPNDLPIRLAYGGTGTIRELPTMTPVHCPFHDDQNPSAFTLRNKKGHPGLHCSTCRRTWWTESNMISEYDFYFYDRKVNEQVEFLAQSNAKRAAKDLPPCNKEAQVINEKYLPDLELREGMTLVKSPKGSGKTTALRALVRAAKAKGKSVLLIGHRQMLLRELATKLGLECYLDDLVLGHPTAKRPDYYAVSVDSLPKRLKRPRNYDIVIVDECEQVFSHVTAKTVKSAPAVMLLLESYIANASHLYLLDADLNQVTLQFAASARRRDPKQFVRLVLNTYIAENRACELYSNMIDLIGDMMKSARAGKRLFVACNSKRRAKLLARMLSKEIGSKARVLLITADEKVSQEVQDFLADVPKQYLQYDAVVASPAIGTGLDITFPHGAQEIDVVYGIFNSGINSHYEIDQQLGRVRNPKEVKVWVCGWTNTYEIELDAIKLDLVETADAHPAVKRIEKGLPIIDMEHPLLNLQASVYQAQRASQNRMKEYFMRHKKLNGWTIDFKEPADGDEAQALQNRMRRLEAEIEQEYIGGVMKAALIDQDKWKSYYDRKAAGEAIGTSAINEMLKFEIRHFYNVHVTPDLVKLDDHGRFRECVKRFESLRIHDADSLRLLLMRWTTYRSKTSEYRKALGFDHLRSLEGILLSSGLLDESGFHADKILSKPDLAGFVSFCNERHITVERDLDVNLRKDLEDDPIRTLNLCLGSIGLQMVCLGKTRNNDVAVYRYRMAPDALDTLGEIMGHRKEGNRSTLPEELDPPRVRSKKPVNDNTILALFGNVS